MKHTNKPPKQNGFNLLELIIAIAIMGLMFGGSVVLFGPFARRHKLETAMVKLITDLRQTQQFARVQKDGYKYYGLMFYDTLGKDNDCHGYKIVRYEPIDVSLPVDLGNFTIIKSSVPADNAESTDNTFFEKNIKIDATSELGIGDSVVFTLEGSATKNGLEFLDSHADEIMFSSYGASFGQYIKTIQIIPLTGHIKIIN